MFEAPVVFHQLDGEPVEQFGVRRRGALAAEVEDGRHERRPEVAHPDVVHHDTGGQRVGPIGRPQGQRRAPPGARVRERPAVRLRGLDV